MRKIKIILILCLCVSFAKAQSVSDNRRVADVYFVNGEYYAAAEYYKKALHINADSSGFVVPYGFEQKIQTEKNNKKEDYEYAVFQLATSLRLYKNFQDAEKWYAIANNFTNQKYGLSNFWYAECLRANSRYEESIMAFNTFKSKYNGAENYKELADREIASCKYALAEISYPRLYKLTKLAAGVNDKGSNYASSINDQTFYFTSSRPLGSGGKNVVLSGKNTSNTVVKKETPYVNALYMASVNPQLANVPVKRMDVMLNKMEVATPTLHPNGNFMFFTAWINKGDKIKSIYVSRKISNDQWSEPKVLGSEINVAGFNSIQPSVSKDGKYFIFSSDRPGGSGKYDLWYALMREDGSVGNAVNMGREINTSGDDQAPYYNPKTKKLLYSSNGKIGLGGFDFYEAEGNFATWTSPKNMGYPFNSPKDDLYFSSLDELDSEGYVSSDRESLCCLELFKVSRQKINISGKLIDCNTLTPLADALVTITGDDISTSTTKSDATGMYSFGISSNRGIQINASKDLYFAKNLSYGLKEMASVDTLQSEELCLVPFKINKPIVLENILYEFDSDSLTQESKVRLNYLADTMQDNKNLEVELGAHTDNMGTAKYNIDLSQRRAASCVTYLIGQGIPSTRLTSKGYGFTIPVAPNQTKNGKDNPEGRALNRRTEFKVTKK